MVSVEKALQIIAQNTKTLDKIAIDVREALHHVLAKEILSPINLPSFRQSAMDGFACKWTDVKESDGSLKIVGESRAGSEAEVELQKGTAMRIFTGAPVPKGADCVIVQEEVEVMNGNMHCKSIQKYSQGKNVREIGEEIKIGEVVLESGHLINPSSIGLLVSMGLEEVYVFRKPKIGLVVTGSELAEFGKSRKSGQVHESNSHTLKAALDDQRFIDISIEKVKDEFEETKNLLSDLSKKCDVIIITGGISVGEYDYVGKSLEALEAKQLFYKIRQKPGKPMYFGSLNNCSVFALPGNPGSMLTCFLIYVLPSLNGMAGFFRGLQRGKVKLATELKLKGERAHFLKATVLADEVHILGRQNSSMLSSFANADCLIYLPEHSKILPKGSLVEVIYF